MAKLLRLRRGTTTQHGSFTGAEGEVTVDTDKETLVVHNGSNAGGYPIAREDLSNVSSASIAGKLGTDSIAPAKIAGGTLPTDVTVASANIVNGTIVTADLADDAIATAKVADNAITTPKIAANAVVTTHIDAQNITTAKIADANITSVKIAGDAVTTAKIADDAVTAAKLANTSVTAGSYGSATAIPAITVDAQGRVTAASTNAVNTTTNLATTTASGSVTVTSSTGTNAAISEATSSAAGVMSTAHHDKLDGIEAGATADQSNAEIRAAVEAATDSNVFTDADHSKLNGIEASATADQTAAEIKTLLAGDNIGAAHIAANSIDSSELVDGAVDLSHMSSESVDEDNLYISNAGTNGQYLQKQSGNNGGLTWATVDLTTLSASNLTSGTIPDARFPSTLPAVSGANLTGIAAFASGTKMLFQQTSAPTGWTKITSSVDNKALRVVSGTAGSGGNATFTAAFASRTPAGNVAATANATASFSGSVSGNTGNSGASTSSVSTSGNVNNHTLSNNQMPSHSHSIYSYNNQDYGQYRVKLQHDRCANSGNNVGTNNTGGGGSHSHGFSGSSHSHNVNNHTHSFSGNFSGNTGNHTHNSGAFSGTAMDFAVQYLDVIVCSKD